MILRRIEVEGFRCFADRVSVGPISEGIQILSGPNGTGKSTVFEALRRALMDRYNAGGAKVSALRPWGRGIAPAVTVEFAHDGEEYRIEKRWLDKPMAKLSRRENGSFVLLDQDAKADDRLRGFFGAKVAPSGLSTAAHWGLGQVLWAPQGELTLDEVTGDLLDRIRAELGSQVEAADRGGVERAIEVAYGAYFTARGRLKSGKEAPELVGLNARIEELSEIRSRALEEMEQVEMCRRRVEEARSSREIARASEAELAAMLESGREKAREYAALVAERDRRSAEAEGAEAVHARIGEKIAAAAAAEAEVAAVTKDLERWRSDLDAGNAQAASMEKALARARAAERLGAARETVERCESKLGKIVEARSALAAEKEERASLVAPTEEQLDELRTAIRERDEARAHLHAAALIVRIELEGDDRVEVERGEAVEGGEGVTIRGSPGVAARIEGVARITAEGPGRGEDWAVALSESLAEIEDLTSGLGSEDPEELSRVLKRAQRLEVLIDAARERLEDLMEDRPEEEWAEEAERARRTLASILADHPDWETDPPVDLDADVAADDLSRAQHAAGQLRGQIEVANQRLGDLEAKRKDEDPDVEEKLAGAALKWHAAKEKLKTIETALAAFDSDPQEEERAFEKSLAGHRDQAEKARDREKSEEGRLRELTAKGAYLELARVEEELAVCRDRAEREGRRSEAIRLLRDTVVACRSEAVAAVAGPVEEAAAYYFHRIAGTSLGEIGLGESLAPERIHPPRADEAVDQAALSGGEREQLHLSVRLALAGVLAKEERQLLVLDDVLTATDAGRLSRVQAALAEAADRLQIVILTCHPERYAGLAGAERIDLVAL